MITLHEGEGSSQQPSQPSTERLLVLNLTVEGCNPPIWRTLHIKDSMWLSDLHDTIQILFNWYDYQTHAFTIGNSTYGNPFKRENLFIEDDRHIPLSELDLSINKTFAYDYHFGEGWRINITLEKTALAQKNKTYPLCTAGERNGPPEDCGGVEYYHDMLECLKEPFSSIGREWREWLGEDFDPEACDLVQINKSLAEFAKFPPSPPRAP